MIVQRLGPRRFWPIACCVRSYNTWFGGKGAPIYKAHDRCIATAERGTGGRPGRGYADPGGEGNGREGGRRRWVKPFVHTLVHKLHFTRSPAGPPPQHDFRGCLREIPCIFVSALRAVRTPASGKCATMIRCHPATGCELGCVDCVYYKRGNLYYKRGILY